MRATPKVVAAILVFTGTVGCSGAVAVKSDNKTPIKTWPVAEPLEGPMPIGRWRCYRSQDFEAMRKSNSAALDQSCNVVRFKLAYEFRAAGTGVGADSSPS